MVLSRFLGQRLHLKVSFSSSHNLYSTPLSRMNSFSVVLSSFSLFTIALAPSSRFCNSFICLSLSGNVMLLVVFSLTVIHRCSMVSTTGVEKTGGISHRFSGHTLATLFQCLFWPNRRDLAGFFQFFEAIISKFTAVLFWLYFGVWIHI